MPQILLLFAFTAVTAVLFGWTRDLPKHVYEEESLAERFVQWVSAFFHVGTPILVILGSRTLHEAGPMTLLVGFAWAVFGSLVLARRVGATQRDPGVVRLRAWWSGLGGARWVMGVWPVVLYGLGVMLPYYAGVNLSLFWPTVLLVGWMYFRAASTGHGIQRHAARAAVTIRDFQNVLAKVFGVSQGEIVEYGRMYLQRNGDLVMSTVPAGVADALRTKGRDAIDAALAGIRPGYMVADHSDHEQIVITPVTEERLARRAELARTGGVFVTNEPAAPAHQQDEAGTSPAPTQASQTLDLTGEEW